MPAPQQVAHLNTKRHRLALRSLAPDVEFRRAINALLICHFASATAYPLTIAAEPFARWFGEQELLEWSDICHLLIFVVNIFDAKMSTKLQTGEQESHIKLADWPEI